MYIQILSLSLITIIAGIIGTVTGFGISTIMVPIVLIFLPLPETLLLVGLIHWFGDLWKVLLFKHGLDKKILIYFGIPGILMALMGGTLATIIPENYASQIVGFILILYVIFIFIKPGFKIKPNQITATIGGGLSGFLGGLTGVGGGALRALVLNAFNIPKNIYIFTSGVLGTLIDASRISAYIISGTKIQDIFLFGFIFFIPASFLGAEIAKRLLNNIPQNKFKGLILIFLFLIGLKFIFFP